MAILICSILLLDFYTADKLKEDKGLKNRIFETINNAEKIDFAEITDFYWEQMYIFTPYSIPRNILKEDGIKTVNSRFQIEILDTINMIGFIDTNKLVAFVELPRSFGGENLLHFLKFSREEAKFKISLDKKAIIFDSN